MLKFLLLPVLALAHLLTACTPGPVGSSENPLRMMFIPYVESQTIITHTDALVKFLEMSLSKKLLGKESGFHIKASVPTSYVAVVEAFGTERADVAALTTFPYILARDIKKYPVEAFLTVDRHPDGLKYRGAIIARADSKMKTIADLQGKKFAFSDPASTSGFILPAKLFKDQRIQLSETVFAGRHDSVVMMVYQKRVDAGAIYYSAPEERKENGKIVKYIRDARSMVTTQIPNAEKEIKIIGFTEDAPNEPWVLRSTVFKDPAEQKRFQKALTESIMEFTHTEEGKTLMRTLVRAEKVVPCDDSFYEPLRSILSELDIDMQELVK